MSERLTDAVREQAEAIWQIGNRHGPDAERKQDIAESLATFTEALRARVAKLEAALAKIRDNDPDSWEASIARAALKAAPQ